MVLVKGHKRQDAARRRKQMTQPLMDTVNDEMAGVDSEEEEDDEVVPQITPSSSSNLNPVRCPWTGSYFTHPVKSKVCHHVYSGNALVQMIGRGHSVRCPIAGCVNVVTLHQCQPDVQTMVRVRHHKRREELRRQKRMRMALIDSEDEQD